MPRPDRVRELRARSFPHRRHHGRTTRRRDRDEPARRDGRCSVARHRRCHLRVCPDADHQGQGPGPRTGARSRANRRGPPAARPARDPPVHDVSGHHVGSVPGDPRGVGADRRDGLRPRLRARAREPRRPGERRADDPAPRGRAHAGRDGPCRPAPQPDQRPRRRADLARRRGDGEAAREHVPQRQHRVHQPARPAVRADGPRRVGGHRRRRDQAVRVHALHARPRRRRPLHPGGPVLPVVARPGVRLHRPLHRAARGTSTSRCRGTSSISSRSPSTDGRRRSTARGWASSASPSSPTSRITATRRPPPSWTGSPRVAPRFGTTTRSSRRTAARPASSSPASRSTT